MSELFEFDEFDAYEDVPPDDDEVMPQPIDAGPEPTGRVVQVAPEHENVVPLPTPAQRAASAKDDVERKRMGALFEANPSNLYGEVKRWILANDPSAKADLVAEHVREPTKRVFDRYLAPGAKPEIVPTGFDALDELMSLEPGSLVTLGARSGRGKSSLSFQMAMNVARRGTGSTLYFSSEMSAEQLMLRGACLMAKVDSKRVRRGLANGVELAALAEAHGMIDASMAWMVDQSGLDVLRIRKIARAEAKRIEQECGRSLRVIVVDYLQRVRAGKAVSFGSNREREVAAIALELKEMAMELGVCVLAPCQLNSASDDRKDDRPNAGDLRESRGIENESDSVLLIHNPFYLKRQSDPEYNAAKAEACELILAKGRNDGTGTVPIWFTPMFTRFRTMTPLERHEWMQKRPATKEKTR